MKIAIFSPNAVAYSETFIEAHKRYLKDQVLFYYGTGSGIQLDGFDCLAPIKSLSFYNRVKNKLVGQLKQSWDLTVLASLDYYRPDVILVEYGTHAHRLLPVLKVTNIPFVVHFHGYDASVVSVIKNNNNYKDVFENASKIIAVSNEMVQRLKKLGCPADKLIYNVYGPRPEFHEVIPTFSKKQFIVIGRFTDKKAPHLTLLAFKPVLEIYPEARLIMAGDGALLEVCKDLARHNEMTDAVHFPGVITADEFRDYLKESLAFVQHSITANNGDMEGTPVAVLEASMAGLPVIATRHAGIPDVILDEETGLLCEERDVAGMTQHMLKILKNRNYAKQLGQAGKTHILEHYTLERHIQSLQRLLEAVVVDLKSN